MTTPNLPNKDAIAEQQVEAAYQEFYQTYHMNDVDEDKQYQRDLRNLLTTTTNARVEQFAAELIRLYEGVHHSALAGKDIDYGKIEHTGDEVASIIRVALKRFTGDTNHE